LSDLIREVRFVPSPDIRQPLGPLASSYGPKETTDRIVTEVTAQGLTIFARIDRAADAAQVGLPLRSTSTELLIFGNAKAGTPLMQSNQEVGIDLPLKMLVWKDAAEKTWLSYNDPRWIAKLGRRGIKRSTLWLWGSALLRKR
jgi:uncharacterized protein (DUF302 family)